MDDTIKYGVNKTGKCFSVSKKGFVVVG